MIVCSAVRAAAWVVAIAALFMVAPDAATSFLNAQMTTTWTFDRLENIGGHRTTVLGEPRVIDSPVGKAVEFDGKDDALFIDNHPLAGAEAFTWEAIFRPDGGEKEQRWFHLNERDPATGADTENRMLFEIRVVDDKWYLRQLQPIGSREQGAHQPDGAASVWVPGTTSQPCTTARNSATTSTAFVRARPNCTWPLRVRAIPRLVCGSTRCSISREPCTWRDSRAERSLLQSFSGSRPTACDRIR